MHSGLAGPGCLNGLHSSQSRHAPPPSPDVGLVFPFLLWFRVHVLRTVPTFYCQLSPHPFTSCFGLLNARQFFVSFGPFLPFNLPHPHQAHTNLTTMRVPVTSSTHLQRSEPSSRVSLPKARRRRFSRAILPRFGPLSSGSSAASSRSKHPTGTRSHARGKPDVYRVALGSTTAERCSPLASITPVSSPRGALRAPPPPSHYEHDSSAGRTDPLYHYPNESPPPMPLYASRTTSPMYQ